MGPFIRFEVVRLVYLIGGDEIGKQRAKQQIYLLCLKEIQLMTRDNKIKELVSKAIYGGTLL